MNITENLSMSDTIILRRILTYTPVVLQEEWRNRAIHEQSLATPHAQLLNCSGYLNRARNSTTRMALAM